MDSKFLIQGPVTAEMVAKSIEKHNTKFNIGAHDIFLGQVRDDIIDGKKVSGIEYSCYPEMADKKFQEIKDEVFGKYSGLVCMHIKHSLGLVKKGEISLMVFVSSGHREESFAACRDAVNLIKEKVPIWGKELFDDDSYVWKENK